MNTSDPDIEYVSQNIQEPLAGDEVIISAKQQISQVELMITTQLDRFNFTSYLMNDNGIDGDLIAGDDIFSLVVPHSDARDFVQYYIRATNDESITFSRKAEYEFYYYTIFPEITTNSDLVINEIMASNDQTIADEFGEFDDWIEIYNNGNQSINLFGYHLSDDLSVLDKYTFPNITLGPDEYFIVWADDDEEEQGDYNHATFKLSLSGEELYLSDQNMNIIDGFTYGEQQTDMGYARVPNGTGNFIIQYSTFSENNNLVSSQIEYLNDDKLIKIVDVLGREISSNHKGFQLNIYNNTVKEYNLSY